MDPTRWRQVEEVVEGAMRRAPQERSAFVVEACGDDAFLRQEVQSLLIHDEAAADNFLEPAPLDVPAKHHDTDALTSLVGQTVSSYEIIAVLGRGGMGTVYLAKDKELGRKVALKLLPEHLTTDEDRVKRFRQEARAASALNHPNILIVHGFGHVGQTFFLATEFIDGQTLRERMAGSLNLADALHILLETARALDAAHTAGIVHRDIKPENVMIRHDGYVKVVDFGLAKLIERRDALPAAPATSTVFQTQPGFLMGTPNYMSPEQLRGDEVDGRSDIWSLGVVIHEIIANIAPRDTSRTTRALHTETKRETFSQAGETAAIADLSRVATKAMSRDKERRYQTARDLMADLIVIKQTHGLSDDNMRRHTPEEFMTPVKSSMPDIKGFATRADGMTTLTKRMGNARTLQTLKHLIRTPDAYRAGGLTLLLLAASFGIFHWQRASIVEHTPPVPSANPIEFTRLAVTDQISECVISQDGKYFATVDEHAGKQSISIRQVTAPNNKRIIVAPNLRYSGLAFSPDGNHVYFLGSIESETTLFRVSTLGEPPRKLIEDVHTSVTFSPDGKQLAFVRGEPGASTLIIADADGTGERELAKRTGRSVFGTFGDQHHRPAWSPNGKIIVCPTLHQEASLEMNLVGVSVEDGAVRQFNARPWYIIGQVTWLSDGSGLVMDAVADISESSTSQLWVIGYPDGKARRLTNDLSGYAQTSLTANSDLLLTTQVKYDSNIWIVSGKGVTQAEPLASSKNKGATGIAWSSDNNLLYSSDESGNYDIWVMDSTGANSRQLTFGKDAEAEPATEPTNRYITYSLHNADGAHVWRMNADGTNQKQLTFGAYEDSPQISPDGKWVVYYSEPESSKDEIWRVPIEGGEPIKLSDMPAKYPSISPDGKLIACFMRNEQFDSPWKLAIIPFEGGTRILMFDVPPTVAKQTHGMRWTSDGRALTYIRSDAGASNIWRQELTGGAPRRVTDFAENHIDAFAWSLDNRQLACVRGKSTTDMLLIRKFR